MFLEKLEVQGFKSFANKNTLVFPGMVDKSRRGLTAVVGPNGSGKSNVADSIRWALGEQSMKTLRGKKGEDVIFSGSDKKGKLGMAEVSLFLNNADRKAAIDYSEVVLTRRLFRSGESEYLINNSRARLYDVQMLLAKANFGQRTYSVIGQGMVEGFLNTSLAERKEFFDEATGVKQFQIKRDEALNKLKNSYENLSQAEMLISEIEPRVQSLTRQVNKLKRRGEIETELKELQIQYYSKIWHEIFTKFSEHNNQYLELEKNKIEKAKKLEQLQRELEKMEAQKGAGEEFVNYQKELNNLQISKDSLVKQIAKIDAQIEMNLESQGKFDVSWLLAKKNELEAAIKRAQEELSLISGNEKEENELKNLESERKNIVEKIKNLNEKVLKLSSAKSGTGEQQTLNTRLEDLAERLKNLEGEEDAAVVRKIVREIREEIVKLVKLVKKEDEKLELEKAHRELMNLGEEREKISFKINELSLKINSAKEKERLFSGELAKLKVELTGIEQKLKEQKTEVKTGDLDAEKNKLKKDLEKIEAEMARVKGDAGEISRLEEEKRNKLFGLQKNLQTLQNEVNELSNRLNEIKINSTRFETRLEDLETEIRQNLGGLKEVKERKVEGEIDIEAALAKINQLKHQLEQIGGIDPEIEKEYIETKERYDFLSGQVNDLNGAIGSLEEIIKELDAVIKERFDKEFKIISEKFEEYFKILFNGGNAKIVKVMDEPTVDKGQLTVDLENSEEGESSSAKATEDKSAVDLKRIKYLQKYNATGLAGIEIQATPPGKKIKSISMLSGGERALTAIGLICAIISANPSPFVVLDEVDAALDEANSERLAKILDDLSNKTQFIVITHNRAAMRRANVLYGVTMGDDGVSKLLSVKLDDAMVK
ncbi:MAG: AAA family ATPase [Patescibacteria group bacterium]|nr:AAA family ATPase [Patescibacteria group bacterium]MDD4611225.1 AAA family ATPase [Patescibacteria group bacterium]